MTRQATFRPGTQRVFIGIPVDKQSQQHINELLQPFRTLPLDISWETDDKRHLTLAFLGIKPTSEIVKLKRLLDEAYQQQPHFHYHLSALQRFPTSSGRIIALVGEPARPLDDLFQITLELLLRANVETDLKDFRPHITLGKVRKPKQLKAQIDQPTNISMSINKIVLYQSTHTESGSIYSSLKETELK
jgi:2'-5' RNA ligase